MYATMNQTIQLRITRDKSFVGCAVGMVVYFGNTQIYSLSNGESAILSIPATPGYLRFKMMGSSLTPHPIKGEVFVDPTACRQGAVDCHIQLTPDWLGMMVGGLFRTVGHMRINLNYL